MRGARHICFLTGLQNVETKKNGISLNGWAMNTRVWCDNLTILDEYDVALEDYQSYMIRGHTP